MIVSGQIRAICCALPLVLGATGALAAETSSSGTVLPGGSSKDPVNIDAAKLDYFDKEQKLVYTGNVIATQGETKLQTGKLVIFLAPKNANAAAGAPSSSSQVRRMEAAGPVTILSKDQIGTGDSGIYERSENKVYLVGNVTLTQGANVTKGDKLIYDLTTKQAVVTGGRVRSLFLPDDRQGDAKEAPASRSVGVDRPNQAVQAQVRPPQQQLQ
jgi:lipopolysaccharide export system protein LptA